MTIKYENEVKIVAGNYLKNVFESWVKEIGNNKAIFIASIPFVRNLIEYIKGEDDENYMKLTHLLHIKSESDSITTDDLSTIYKSIWNDKIFAYANQSVSELLFSESDRIIADTSETVQLESKIILSISIRLLAEKFMIHKITDKDSISRIKKHQTSSLTKLFKSEYPNSAEELKLIEQVNLMSAENIHINAFMYEPILDLSDKYLKEIYVKIKALTI